MKTHTAAIHARYLYDPRMVTEHGTPLYDRKTARHIRPTTTLRIRGVYFTPKQVVYILNHSSARPTPDTPDPFVTIPPFILNRDGDPNNILYGNLKASNVSRRWAGQYVEAKSGALIPKHLIAAMGPEDLKRFGVVLDGEDDDDYNYQ
jgi:hypothetical protein